MKQTDLLRIYREYCEQNGWVWKEHPPVPMALYAIYAATVQETETRLTGAINAANTAREQAERLLAAEREAVAAGIERDKATQRQMNDMNGHQLEVAKMYHAEKAAREQAERELRDARELLGNRYDAMQEHKRAARDYESNLRTLEMKYAVLNKSAGAERSRREQAERERDALADAMGRLMRTIDEYTRQTMESNPEWRDGIHAATACQRSITEYRSRLLDAVEVRDATQARLASETAAAEHDLGEAVRCIDRLYAGSQASIAVLQKVHDNVLCDFCEVSTALKMAQEGSASVTKEIADRVLKLPEAGA